MTFVDDSLSLNQTILHVFSLDVMIILRPTSKSFNKFYPELTKVFNKFN